MQTNGSNDAAPTKQRRMKRLHQRETSLTQTNSVRKQEMTSLNTNLDLSGLEGDIVNITAADGQRAVVHPQESNGENLETRNMAAIYPSNTTDLLYLEQKKRFRAQSRRNVEQHQARRAELNLAESKLLDKLTKVIRSALSTHIMFVRIAHVFEGVLAGVAFWLLITLIFGISVPASTFIISYSSMAEFTSGTLQCLLFFAALRSLYPIDFLRSPIYSSDMVPIQVNWKKLLVRNLPLVLLYLTALVLNASLETFTRQLGVISTIQSESGQSVAAKQLEPIITSWLPLNILLCILILIGWFVSTLAPSRDRTELAIRMHVEEVQKYWATTASSSQAGDGDRIQSGRLAWIST